ncbi:hypothetical protein JCM19037_2329 [Geomicrobium sp. JCM 19037]|uniref:hypothetical protein n=1 Tax=unclassified Geomicrobium TaxID=2628951 RepID=UPI00045F3E55|nr:MULTISPECIES: hypothetical protein [unclassified Geomicrobium]GAK03961.1 hypothetical protein JCM19037_2329 [Geomicrobium sp. JCM 19037]GAK13560.1 hypothetical protein JCM19039_3416 [Geomicrobium sp. JCM 19039]
MSTTLIIVIFIFLLLFIVYADHLAWKTIAEAPSERATHVIRKHSILTGRGVKCRLRTITPKLGAGSTSLGISTTRLEVHRRDATQADQYLADAEDETRYE